VRVFKKQYLLLCLAFTAYGAPKMNQFILPIVIPFSPAVVQAYPIHRQHSVGVEIFKSQLVTPLSLLSITDNNKIKLEQFPLNEYDGGAHGIVPQNNPLLLALRTKYGITVLDLEKKKKVVEYDTWLTKDLLAGLFQSKMVDSKKMLAISDIDPSADTDGQTYRGLHSLVFQDLLLKKTISRVIVGYTYKGETPPVFFASDVIIYKKDRENRDEPWKTLDNSLRPVEHQVGKILDEQCKSQYIFDMAISAVHKCAVASCYDETAQRSTLRFLSWQTNTVLEIPLHFHHVAQETRLMLSPSEKWVCVAACPDDHESNCYFALIYLDPSLPDGFCKPIVFSPKNDRDIITWMTEPEGLVIFSEGHLSWWDLSKFDPQNPDAKKQ
jgi:hypothetical protein